MQSLLTRLLYNESYESKQITRLIDKPRRSCYYIAMYTYAILQNPGHNRVYFNASRTLALHELSLATRLMSVGVVQIREDILGGVPYVLFDTDKPLISDDLTRLSRLSFVYAIFAVTENRTRFTPLLKDGAFNISDDIGSMLKYTGKTNELFTRMMLNIAMSVSPYDYREGFFVIDPLCGKGTTLFECLKLGINAAGVEIDEKPVHEAYVFLKKYLETVRCKHNSHIEKTGGIGNDNKKFSATRYRFELPKNKTKQIEIITGDTRYMNTYFKKGSFHALVGDLPYGVQHGSDKNKGGITRNAMGMLTEALPEWVKVLKPGGVVVLAWNLYLIPRTEMETLFIKHGLELPGDALFTQFAHRVDQAIERDLIVAVKP